MRPRTLAMITAVPIAVAAVSVALASGATTAHQARATDGRTLTFYQGDDSVPDLRRRSPSVPNARLRPLPRFRSSPGDHLYFGGPLFTRKGGRRTGRIDFELTALRGQGDKMVTFLRGTIVLKDGILTLEGVYPHRGGLAVTGGTGAYAGARGVARQDDNGIDTITLIP